MPVSRGRALALTPWAILPTIGHLCLLAFTLLLVIKLQGIWKISWWFTFSPLWVFHAIMARCTCSMPAPTTPYDRQWSPCHSLYTLPLLLSFELLLCCHLAALDVPPNKSPISLVIVFAPLLLLEFAVLFDNFRMCIILMPGEDDNMTDEALWETLPHFAVAVSMVFFIAFTIFTVLKLTSEEQELVDPIDWWTLLVDLCIGEFFAFLLCFKWANPHQPRLPVLQPLPPSTPAGPHEPLLEEGSSGAVIASVGSSNRSNSSPVGAQGALPQSPRSVSSSDEGGLELHCGAAEFGGHAMKAGLVAFQVLLCMKLQEEPWAASMSLWTLFSPLLVVQCLALLSALLQLSEFLLLRYAPDTGSRFSAVVQEHDPFVFSTKGMRLASWWCKEDEVREERRSLMDTLYAGYQTFDPTPTEYIKKMRKGELKHEVLRLQSALVDQGETLKTQRQELDRVHQEKILCRVCFEREISLVLLPCRHRVLCSACAEKCKHCPICRRYIAEKMAVFDV